jgi:serine/threonine-protein kinase
MTLARLVLRRPRDLPMQTGDVLNGKYQILRQLGQGGMGAVYEARHLGTGRRVAVKVIIGRNVRDRPEMLARFQREARAAGAIESQHVAQVFDTGSDTTTGDPYLVMEFLSGRDLESAIQALGPLPPDVVLRVAAQATIGLAKAHEAGVVHRDIKSANVFLARQDVDAIVVKLLDFGIAKVTDDQFSSSAGVSLTQSGALLGSPLYMSPEQAKGSKTIDHRTDIWSLGIVLYEALTGATPFAHCETLGPLILAIYSDEPKPIRDSAPWVPPEIASLVHKALSRDPTARFSTAKEMFEAVRSLLTSGYSLHESMMVRLPEAQRSSLGSTARISSPPARVSTAPAPAPAALSYATAAGVETVPRPSTRRRPLVPIAAVGISLVMVAGIALRQMQHHSDAAVPSAASADSSATASPAPSIAAAPENPPTVDHASLSNVVPPPAPSSADAVAVAPAPSAVGPRVQRLPAASSARPGASAAPAPPVSAPPVPSSKPAKKNVYDQMY